MSGLNNATADALAQAICTSLGTSNPDDLANWKKITRPFYQALKNDIIITILAGTIVTNGSPTTQSGPATPLVLPPA